MVVGGIEILIVTSFINVFGDVTAVISFDNREKKIEIEYIVTGCEKVSDRWAIRENMASKWIYNGPKVVDGIATEVCQRHFPMGAM